MKPTSHNHLNQSFRSDILQFASEQYQTEPEYPWRTAPDYAVLRRSDNKKWYGLIMNVPRCRLGLSGEEMIDILDIKCDPILAGSLRLSNGFFPAYHMNHENWITILLDGTVTKEQIFSLLELSYELTANKRRKRKASSCFRKNWIVPANPKYYDLDKGFAESETIIWKQSSNISVGDTVYLYVAAPISAILYRCQALEVGIPYDYDDGKVHMSHVMRLKPLKQYAPDAFPLDKLKEHGVFSVRGPRYVPNSLLRELEGCSHEQ